MIYSDPSGQAGLGRDNGPAEREETLSRATPEMFRSEIAPREIFCTSHTGLALSISLVMRPK